MQKKPYQTTLDQVRISRQKDTAVIEYLDPSVVTTHFTIGPQVQTMSDQELLDIFNETIRTREEFAAANPYVAVEVPPGSPQVRYFARGDQWVPRGDVLRCLVHDNSDREVVIEIDGRRFSLREFGRMLMTYAGWGMRICFVPDDELEREPDIEVREPDDEGAD